MQYTLHNIIHNSILPTGLIPLSPPSLSYLQPLFLALSFFIRGRRKMRNFTQQRFSSDFLRRPHFFPADPLFFTRKASAKGTLAKLEHQIKQGGRLMPANLGDPNA